MGNNIKKLEFDCVNRIKYEKREKFEESLFADAYDKAARLVTLIIEENVKEVDTMDDSFCTEERFNNIISFWGERGMGKSSAMLSFALFLKKYDHGIEDRFHLDIGTLPEFYVLPRIDAAMLVKGEYLLDIILAKMWNDFEEKAHFGFVQDSKFNEAKQYFGDVKKSYESYRKAISGDDKYEMTSVRQLKELSKCLNLKEDFKKLVNSFLLCMSPNRGEINFLVLAIDDLDVVVDDVNNILEQIRLFLSVPKVIVLATADYGRLFLDCNKSFSDRLICKENIDYLERRQIRGYSEKYLAKIFPNNMRVHMPKINVAGGVDYKVMIPEGSNLVNNGEEAFDEKRLLFVMLAKYTNIMMYPFDSHRHLLQKTSLRGIVNELFELEKMNDMEEQERFETACSWIQTALAEEGKTIMESGEYDWAQAVMEGDSVNETIVEIFAMREENEQKQNMQSGVRNGYGQMLRLQGEREWTGYGQMLKLLMRLVESTGHDYKRFTQFALIFYSVQVAKLFQGGSRRDDFVSLYVKNVFYPSVEAAAQKKGDRKENGRLDSLPADCLQMILSIPGENLIEGIQQFFIINQERIYNVFKLANLCEWNLWDESDGENAYVQFKAFEEIVEKVEDISLQISTKKRKDNMKDQGGLRPEEDVKKRIRLDVPKIDHSKISIEILLWNSLFYEEHLKGFCRNIYKALCTLGQREIDKTQMDNVINGVISNPGFHMKVYKKWRKSVTDIDSLLPWQSAEIMLHLAGEIGSVQQLVGEKDLLGRILLVQRRQMERVIREMEGIEDYYQPLFVGRKRYSQILKSYQKDMEPYNIKEKLINQLGEQTIDSKPAV